MALGPPTVDLARETRRVVTFIRKEVRSASANGVVIGLSGGIDSSVAGALCVRALSKNRVVGLLMPSDHTPSRDVKDALAMAESWGIRTEKVPVSMAVESIKRSASIEGTRIALANVEARVRMTILYFFANALGFLVAGTGDKSETLLGYFTKMGDGGVDFLPIAHLYKTQVREMGAYLDLPRSVVEKPASPQLWPGHRASDEIPADYDKLDIVLYQLFDLKKSPREASLAARLPISVAEKTLEMHARSAHKRLMPPSLA